MDMDPFDEILSGPGVTSRTGSKFLPKIRPRPKKQTLAPQLSTLSQDKKETISDAKSCHDGRGNTKSIKSSFNLAVIEEIKESEDDLLLATVRSDFIGSSHPTSLESATLVDSMQFDLDSCGSVLPSGSTTDGLIQTEDGHLSDDKIAGENIDMFYELECLDDLNNQPKNEADHASLKKATISNEDGDLDKQMLEIEECGAGADITMDTLCSGATTPSEQSACKYIPKPKTRTANEDTRCMHEASSGTHLDGVLNDSSINFDGYTPVNQHTDAPVNVESLAYDSYGDILVDDFNSDDQDEMSREVVFRVVRAAKKNLQWNQTFLSSKRCSPKLVKKLIRLKLQGS